ncbi:chromate efflux transporter [Sphingorhabdus arenilitoris]|uniref:Chromate efflux transporter n=1 Tax=Sphingorhabdus arenilitoris TaxID=1490041 RepID=A0ABV8RJ72_9SPHN
MVELTKPAHPDAPLNSLPSLSGALPAWGKIAALSFGGPAGQIAVMHRILVEEKRWISHDRFMHALNFCMLLPGPEAMQLAAYCGWMMHGIKGGLLAGIFFILPGMAAIMALSVAYVSFADAGWMQGLFFGMKAAVLAIVLSALLRIGAKALSNLQAKAIAVVAFIALAFFAAPFPLVVIAAAVAGYLLLKKAPAELSDDANKQGSTKRAAIAIAVLWGGTLAGLLFATGPKSIWSDIGLFFSQLAILTFGGAYAVLAWVGQVAVTGKGWLAPGEMLDGLGMAESTPGPLVMVLQFVGFMAAYRNPGGLDPMLAGILGGLLTSWVTFLPCFLWIFVGAPHIERLRGNAAISAALAGVTAAVVGVIANLALWFAIHFLFNASHVIESGPFHMTVPDLVSLNGKAAILSLIAGILLLYLKWGLLRVMGVSLGLGMLLTLMT